MKHLFLLGIILCLGCAVVGEGPGYSSYNQYDVPSLMVSPLDHSNEKVEVTGILTRGFEYQSEFYCSQYYFLDGTDLEVRTDLDIEAYVGARVNVKGTMIVPLCSGDEDKTRCQCRDRIEVDTIDILPDTTIVAG